MTRSRLFLAALATIAVLDSASGAQSLGTSASSSSETAVAKGIAEQARFTGGVDLVSLDICVRDSTGRFMAGLAPDEFFVLENGKPQAISFVVPSGAVPLTAILLIDVSGSMVGLKLTRALEAARTFAELLGPQDRLEMIAFNSRAERILAFDEGLLQVRRALSSAIGAIFSSGAAATTALYDALLVSANDLVGARAGTLPDTREVIIVLSDGEDTSSRVGFDEVLLALRRSGALVYSVSFRANDRGEWLGASWPLFQLAHDTGARALGVPRLDALPALFAEINAEVRHLYRIGYVSDDQRHDGQWRTVSVRVLASDAHIRTRAGYYAARQRMTGTRP